MLTLHHLERSRSQRILWLFEELGLDYEFEFYERDPKTKLAPRALKELHPLGKSPIVTDGDRVLAESAHIIEYVIDEYGDGRLRPEVGTDDYLRYRYWMHYAEGSGMNPLLLKVVFVQMIEQTPLLGKPLVAAVSKTVQKGYVDREARTHMKYWEGELADREWFVSDEFSAADIQMSFVLIGAQSAYSLSDYPNIRRFIDQVGQRPAFQRAIEKGGPVRF